MASRGKRIKGKALPLNAFLADKQTAPAGFAVVNKPVANWADAMEDEAIDDKFTLDQKVVLPTAPKASRGPDIDMARIPVDPPYTAYVGNLAYEISEEDLMKFFKNLRVTSVRLPREQGERNRMRGFGYVEFDDRQSLIDGLAMNNEMLRNRAIRINLASEKDHDGGPSSDRDRRGGGGSGGEDRTVGDWRAGREEPFPSRNDSRRNDSRDRSYYRGRDSYENPNRRSDDDRYGGSRGRRGGESEDHWRREDRQQERSEASRPKERPKLQLKPRTAAAPQEESGPKQTSSSIFGGAKPVDTASREREIEYKLDIKPEELPKPAPPSNASIFGSAKPVDTAQREREIEKKLLSQTRPEESKKSGAPPKTFYRSSRTSPSRRGYDDSDRGGRRDTSNSSGRNDRRRDSYEDSRQQPSDGRKGNDDRDSKSPVSGHSEQDYGERKPSIEKENPDNFNRGSNERRSTDRNSEGSDDRRKEDYGNRPSQRYDDAPRRDHDNRTRRDYDDRSKREYSDRPRREYNDGPRRDNDDRPRRDNDDRPRRDNDDRPRRDNDDRPRRENDDRPRRENDGPPRDRKRWEQHGSGKDNRHASPEEGPRQTNYKQDHPQDNKKFENNKNNDIRRGGERQPNKNIPDDRNSKKGSGPNKEPKLPQKNISGNESPSYISSNKFQSLLDEDLGDHKSDSD